MEEQKILKFRWFAFLTLCVASIAQGMTLISPAPLIGELVKVLGLSLGEATGATMGPFTICVAISAVIGGVTIDRFGLVSTYICSMILLILGCLLVPVLGDTLPGLVGARVIQGLGSGPVIGSVAKIAAEWFPPKERAIVTGVQGASLSVGIAIGFGVAPAIFAKTGDWQIALASMAVAGIIGLVLTIIMAFGPTPPKMSAAETNLNEASQSESEFKIALKLPVFWIGVFSCFLLSWTMQGYNDITPGHLAIAKPVGLGLGPVIAGQYMGLLQLAFMVGSAVSGLFIYRVFGGKHRRVVSFSFILTGLFCVSVLLPMVNLEQKILLLCLILAGFFMGMPIPSVMAFISDFYPERITGRIGGATMGIAILGGVLGIAVGSAALHHSGMYTISIYVVGIVCLLGFFNGFALKPPQKVYERS